MLIKIEEEITKIEWFFAVVVPNVTYLPAVSFLFLFCFLFNFLLIHTHYKLKSIFALKYERKSCCRG